MGAELTVTGWFLSPIIREMQDTALAYTRGQFSWKEDQEKDLGRLDITLTEILIIVDVIEKREIKDANQRRLLSKLKDAIYSAVDVLDSFQYMVLESKVASQSMVSHVTSSCIYLGKRLIGTDSFRRKLADILEKLGDVKTTADTLLKVVSFDNATAKLLPVTQLRVTSPLKENHHIYGRRDELDKLRNMLVEISDSNQAPGPSNAPVVPSDSSIPNVISIVGVGGIGKTSLAQLAFRDEQIRMNFSLRMWVSVSDTYDEIRLARDILESLTDANYQTITEFDKLQNALREKIDGKKFLLMLDDVWYDEDRPKWENELVWSKVLSCLNTGMEGSKILATTRADKACSILDATTPPLRLGGLDIDDYWLLFRNCAFGEKYPGQFPELKKIGVQICRRLNGLPLGAKIIGGLLSANLDVKHWEEVRESDLSDDVMKVLRLSYQHLPIQLKLCFSFCSLFPKDWRFDPTRLTEMWIAHGFVQRKDQYDNDAIEDVAKGYFDELVQRAFFERSLFGHPDYVMHDLINDLARNVSKDEYVRVENGKQQKEIPPNIRHLSLSANMLDGMKKTELRNLRTLIVWKKTSPCLKLSLPDDVFNKSKSIRVLDLSGCCLDRLPRSVQVLKHLRYFAFRVPEKPWKIPFIGLYHLEVLVTSGHSCRESECANLPAAKMKKNLLKLRKAFLYNVYGATIPGFGGQTGLHGIGEFHVRKESGHRLDELKEMKNIVRHLKIRSLENVQRQEEAVNASLDCKEQIEYLELEWSIHARDLTCDFDYDVLSALRPHPDLGRLKITGYRGARSPDWFETNWLTALSSLDLENCIGWVHLPPFGQLPQLKYLVLRGMHAVRQIGQEFYGNGDIKGFPVLEEIVFDGMLNWEGWSGTEDGLSLLPCLERLHISRCPKLREISTSFSAKPRVEVQISSDSPPASCLINALIATASRMIFVATSYSLLSDLNAEQLNHVDELNLKNCTDPMPAGGFHRLGSLQVFRISDCSTLLSSVSTEAVEGQDMHLLPPSLCYIEISRSNVHCSLLPRYLQGLACLSTLVLDSCHSMTSLSFASEPNHLTALETITIRDCNELALLDGFGNLSALQKLVVANCYNFCSLPADLNVVGSLEKLVVCGCPMMRFLPEDGLPTSLQTVLLSRCHPELESQLQRKEGAEWSKIVHIPEKKLEVELIDLLTLFPGNSS